MIKFGTVLPYLKKIHNPYRLHLKKIPNHLNFFLAFKSCFNKHGCHLMSAKLATPGLLKIKVFSNVHDATNKLYQVTQMILQMIINIVNYIVDYIGTSISMREMIITSTQ